uniref:CX domain-containing protein n=1 Tax=Panagrellus redivivus TaxID=6233 RepID=A0A7E4W8G1_PANRE
MQVLPTPSFDSWMSWVLFLAISMASVPLPIVAIRQQIGFYPLKGNMYRVKYANEIFPKQSLQWKAFFATGDFGQTISEVSNLTYWIGPKGQKQPESDPDADICFHDLDDPPGGIRPDRKLRMYFQCDAFCCADECCQRDWPVTIIGIVLIVLAVIIPVYCLLQCLIARLQMPPNAKFNNNNSVNYKSVS